MPRHGALVPRPFALSPQEERSYTQLAASVVRRNSQVFADYLDGTPIQKSEWKLLKRREMIDIYRSRETHHPDIFAPARTFSVGPRAQLAKLLCVGTLDGSLDDAMLGCVAPTAISMVAQSNYVHDGFVQHQALCTIKSPTVNDPFEYVGLKWALRPSRVASLVSPRDFVYVEATGYHYLLRCDGTFERIGYVVYHSVDRVNVPRLSKEGVVRAKLSLCVFFRDAGFGTVQVFGSIMANPGGQLLAKAAADSAANALIAVSRAMGCAHKRKLVWLLRQHVAETSDKAREYPATLAIHKWWCGRCTRELPGRSTRAACRICETPVCSRCFKTKKLALEVSATILTVVSLPVCTGCLALASRLENAGQVALDIVFGHQAKQAPKTKLFDQQIFVTSSTVFSTGSSVGSPSLLCPARDTMDPTADADNTSQTRSRHASHSSPSRSRKTASVSFSPLDADTERQRMLRVMSNLCLQAEETYSATVSLTSRGGFEDPLAR